MDVDAAPQREVDGAGRDEGVRVAVIERKTRGLRQVGEGVERERRSGGYRARADVAALQDARRLLAERLDVEAVLDRGHGGGDLASVHSQQIIAAGEQRLLGDPGQMRRELVRDLWGMLGVGEYVAAAEIDMRGEADGDGFSGFRLARARSPR